MEMLDGTIVTTAAPSIGRSLGVAGGAVALRIGGSFDLSLGHSFSLAFLILAAVCLIATAGALRLDRGAGDVLRGRHRPAGIKG